MSEFTERLRVVWPRTTKLFDKYPIVTAFVFFSGMLFGCILFFVLSLF